MRPIKIGLIFLAVFMATAVIHARPLLHQEKKVKVDLPWSENLYENLKSLAFFNSLAIVPVKFIDRTEDQLTAQFWSPIMVQQMNFKLPPSKDHTFFKVKDDWEEEIGRREFLKKFKNDFWLVVYVPGADNFIYETHQFKNWGSLKVSYAHNPDNILGSLDILAYWIKMKVGLFYFNSMAGDMAYWIFISPTEEWWDLARDNGLITLGDGTKIPRRLKTVDGFEVRVINHGIFTIHKNCIFNIIEKKNPKLKIASISLLGNVKTRPKTVGKDYFVKNMAKALWFCFYDSESKTLLRVIEAIGESEGNESEKEKSKNN